MMRHANVATSDRSWSAGKSAPEVVKGGGAMSMNKSARRPGFRGTVIGVGTAVGLTAIVGGILPGIASAGSTSKGPVTEAIVIAYTGPTSFEGTSADSGVYPAMYEINQAGGILGHQLNVVTEDTRGDPADAVPIVDKLLATTSNLVGVTGPGTASAPTIVPILNAAHMTDMTWGGEASFDRSSYSYMWRLIPPDFATGVAMNIWAKARGYTKVAAVFGTDSGSQGDLPGVLAGVRAIHAKLVANIGLTPDQPSYRAEVERVLAAHPQVIMTESDGTTAATFFAEMKQLGHLVPIIGNSAATLSSWINPVRSAISASQFTKYLTVVAEGTPKPSPATVAYAAGLKAEASKVPAPEAQWVTNPHSGAGYDGVIIQALAMNAAHSTSPQVYNKFINAVTSKGAGKTVVYTYAEGKTLLAKGKKIQYIGVTGPALFNRYHNAGGNQAAEQILANDQIKVIRVITQQQIQALG
jgi:branched-chain amino acid transport system substrate-binding protein